MTVRSKLQSHPPARKKKPGGGRGGAEIRQIPLDLPFDPQFGHEDFLVSASNREAWDWIEKWPDWPAHILLLIGPDGAGKSHLGTIWAQRAGVRAALLSQLTLDNVQDLGAHRSLWLDHDVNAKIPERELFHLANLVRENSGHMLITARQPPGLWNIVTPDLLSRLRLAPVVEIGAPDEALIRSVLVKLFFDRQLEVDANVVEFLAARIERSLAGVRKVVELLDREALARHRAITRPMAAEVLKLLDGEGA